MQRQSYRKMESLCWRNESFGFKLNNKKISLCDVDFGIKRGFNIRNDNDYDKGTIIFDLFIRLSLLTNVIFCFYSERIEKRK